MIAASPKHLSVLLVLFVPLILFFRGDLSRQFHQNQTTKSVRDWSQNALHHQSNASSFEHDGVFDETAEGAPRITQVSMQFGGNFDLFYERGLRTHIENGEKWGYPTHYLRHDIVGRGEVAEGVYDKLLYLLTIMVNEMTKPYGKRAEWLVWFDADTVLLNHHIPWTIFLPPSHGMFNDINMLISRDWLGFNAGIFLIRVCEWSVHAMSDAIALPRLRPEIDLPFREQDALKWVFELPENKRHRIYQPRHWFNVYDTYYEGRGEVVMNGSLIVHFPGMGSYRADGMGKWLDILDHNPSELQIPLADTSYPSEIEAYWSRLRSAESKLDDSDRWKSQQKEENHDAWASAEKKFSVKISKAEKELHEVIEDEPFEKERLRKAVLNLDSELREAKKVVEEVAKKLQEEEEAKEQKKKQEEEEKKKKEEEEKLKKEAEEKKAVERIKQQQGDKKKEIEENKKKGDTNSGDSPPIDNGDEKSEKGKQDKEGEKPKEASEHDDKDEKFRALKAALKTDDEDEQYDEPKDNGTDETEKK